MLAAAKADADFIDENFHQLVSLVPEFSDLPESLIQGVSLTVKILEKFQKTPHSIKHYQAYEKEEGFMKNLNAVKLNIVEKEDSSKKGDAKEGEKSLAKRIEQITVEKD